MKKILLLAALLAAAPLAANAADIEAAYGTPEIDGVMESAWDAAPERKIETYTGETHGASGVFRVMWDEQNIYVFADVADPVVSAAAAAAHEQDSIEIFLDENNGKTEYYEYDDSQYRVSCENSRSYSTGAVADFTSAAVKTDVGYAIEAAIPFKTIMGSVDREIGFEIQINDDGTGAGARTSVSKFHDPTDLSYCNTSRYGTLKLNSPERRFTDSEQSERSDIVSYMARVGLLEGYDDGSFGFDRSVTREEFLKLLLGTFEIDPIEGENSFDDVPAGAWFESYVSTGVGAGIIQGMSDTEFGAGRAVTNDETAKMICRAMRYTGVDIDAADGTEIDYLKSLGCMAGGADVSAESKRGDGAASVYRARVYSVEYAAEKKREEEKMQNYGKELIKASGAKEIGNNNPLYTQRFGADPFAMEYDGRIYIYMSGDELMYDGGGALRENDYSNINTVSVISSADLVNWTDHGQIDVGGRINADGAAKWALNSWAPSAAHKTIDGKEKFFLYFADNSSGIGVLESDSPTGPFTDPLGTNLIKPGDVPGTEGVVWYFDPAVFIDDDGSAYLYFGGGIPSANGVDETDHPKTIRVVKLGSDMTSVVGEAVTIDAPAAFEDSGIHKYNGIYYYSYCTNFGGSHEDGRYPYGAITYMTSDNPMGPFEYQGTVLSNVYDFFGIGGNNHHAIFEFKDKWYITYHAQTVSKYLGIEKGYRSTHMNELTYNPDGTIVQVKGDYAGVSPAGTLNPYEEIPAATFAWISGVSTRPDGNGDMLVTAVDDGDWAAVAETEFGEGAKAFKVKADAKNGGAIELRLDAPDGELIGNVKIDGSADEYSCGVTPVSGTHKLFLVFKGEGEDLFELSTWQFSK